MDIFVWWPCRVMAYPHVKASLVGVCLRIQPLSLISESRDLVRASRPGSFYFRLKAAAMKRFRKFQLPLKPLRVFQRRSRPDRTGPARFAPPAWRWVLQAENHRETQSIRSSEEEVP